MYSLPNTVCRSSMLKMTVSISVGRVEKVFESVGKCFLFQPIRAPHALSPRFARARSDTLLRCERLERGRDVTGAVHEGTGAPYWRRHTHTHTHTHSFISRETTAWLQSSASPQLSAINSARNTWKRFCLKVRVQSYLEKLCEKSPLHWDLYTAKQKQPALCSQSQSLSACQ